jgi:hypothetical protein
MSKTFKVKLAISERFKLSDLLIDEESSFARLKMIRKFREELSLSEVEMKAVSYKLHDPDDSGRAYSTWDKNKEPNKEFEIGEIMLEIICKKLKKLNDENQLRQDQFDLYAAFDKEITDMFK